MFRAIASDDFPPFGKFRMDFPPVENKPADLAEVHLLTGVNGTGKTRLLAWLAAMLGGPVGLIRRLRGVTETVVLSATDAPGGAEGSAVWAKMQAAHGGLIWAITRPLCEWAARVPAFAYDGAAYVSDAAIAPMAGVKRPERLQCLSFSRPDNYSAALLQAIANLKMQAAMDSMGRGASRVSSRAAQIVQSLEGVLSDISGHEFLFHVRAYPNPALQVQWANVQLPFDLLPDGLRSVIGWLVDAVVMMDAWLQGKGSPAEVEAVFLLDEPETHLHPAWQRRVVPAFQGLFPKAQIFVATHSPFVVSSLTHGWIHKLRLEKDGKVTVEKPVRASPGESYISVVEDIMGLEEWYDPETEKQLAEFRAERDRAYKGDGEAKARALKLAQELSARSMELSCVMGREINQMERQLANVEKK